MFTIAQIQAAYANHPTVEVCSGLFRRIINGKLVACCPMSILALEDGKNLLDDNFSVMEWIDEKYGSIGHDFWKAFDNRRWYDEEELSEGHKLGLEARKLLIHDKAGDVF